MKRHYWFGHGGAAGASAASYADGPSDVLSGEIRVRRRVDSVTIGDRQPALRDAIAPEREVISGKVRRLDRADKQRGDLDAGHRLARAGRPRWLVPVAVGIVVVGVVGIGAVTVARNGGDDGSEQPRAVATTPSVSTPSATAGEPVSTERTASTDRPSTTDRPAMTTAPSTSVALGLAPGAAIQVGFPPLDSITPPMWVACSPGCVAVFQFQGDYFMGVPIVGGAISGTEEDARTTSCGPTRIPKTWTYIVDMRVVETDIVETIEVPTRVEGDIRITSPGIRSDTCIEYDFDHTYSYTGHGAVTPHVTDKPMTSRVPA